jgi:uncharacterized protein (TIGR02246 family)
MWTQDETQAGLVMIDDVETITASVAEAFNRHDSEGIADLYTEDAQILPPDAPLVEGRHAFIAMLNATFAAGGQSIQFKTVSMRQDGDLLIQVGRYIMGITASRQSYDDPGKFVSVYARQPDGGLLITVTCFNRDATPQPRQMWPVRQNQTADSLWLIRTMPPAGTLTTRRLRSYDDRHTTMQPYTPHRPPDA